MTTPPPSDVRRLKVLRKLFKVFAFAPGWKGDDEDIIESYLTALAPFSSEDIEAAFVGLLQGKFEFFDGRFRPSPTQISRACYTIQSGREAHERRLRQPQPLNLPPLIKRSEESKAKVAEMVRQVVRRNGESS